MPDSSDFRVRVLAMEWLRGQITLCGDDVLDWSVLSKGLAIDGRRVPLVSQQGIFKPALCELPLSIRTSSNSPYDDHFVEDRLSYRYFGSDPGHRDNRGLRSLMERRHPLIYFHAVRPGRYLAVFPVLIVADDPANLRFWVQASMPQSSLAGASLTGPVGGASTPRADLVQAYSTREVQVRLHQRGFRERVLDAYRNQCAMCRLKHREMLDAAHIKPDSEGGQPVLSNGLSLCKIHHTAFDIGVLGVRPETLRVCVRPDVLEEVDGPMLKHGLQALDGASLWTPRTVREKPDPELLRWKWDRFQNTG
jgi:putative restriction endonuclease